MMKYKVNKEYDARWECYLVKKNTINYKSNNKCIVKKKKIQQNKIYVIY